MRQKGLKFLAALMLVAVFIGILPSTYVKAAPEEQPKIYGKAGITIDANTGEIIYAYNADEKMYPASITKLMTAILLAENKNKTDLIKYTETAYNQPAYSLRTELMRKIAVGDSMTADDVMKALLLFSANDSAYMIADAVGGSSENFIKMMNDKAKALNLKNTNFVTANGLHDDNHYSTAYDISILGREAYKNPWIKEVMQLKEANIRTSSGIIAIISNRNKLIGKDGAIGGKTGYTDQSGRCLVELYERDGRAIVGVVMKSAYDADDSMVFKDMETIINWSYNQKPVLLHAKDSVIKTENITYKPLKYFGPTKTIDVPVLVKEDITYYDNVINKSEVKDNITLNNIDPWKLSSDSNDIGILTLNERESNKQYTLYTTVSTKDLISASKGLYIVSAVGAIVIVVVILAVLLLIIRAINRSGSRSRRRRYR